MFLFVNYEIEADLPHNKQECRGFTSIGSIANLTSSYKMKLKLEKCLAEVFKCPGTNMKYRVYNNYTY